MVGSARRQSNPKKQARSSVGGVRTPSLHKNFLQHGLTPKKKPSKNTFYKESICQDSSRAATKCVACPRCLPQRWCGAPSSWASTPPLLPPFHRYTLPTFPLSVSVSAARKYSEERSELPTTLPRSATTFLAVPALMATEKKQFSLVLVTYLWLFRIIFHILFFSLIYRNWWNFHYSHRSCFQRKCFYCGENFSFVFIFYWCAESRFEFDTICSFNFHYCSCKKSYTACVVSTLDGQECTDLISCATRQFLRLQSWNVSGRLLTIEYDRRLGPVLTTMGPAALEVWIRKPCDQASLWFHTEI